jgi:hypothetical protein
MSGWRLTWASAAAVTFGLTVSVRIAHAQCRPPASTHEARLLAFYAAPFAFSSASAPRMADRSVYVSAEVIPVPVPDRALRQPEFCYQNTTNNTRLAPLFGRPRLTVSLPAGFTVEASYLPTISVSRATARSASAALARIQSLPLTNGHVDITLRAHATSAKVTGPITCPDKSLQLRDPVAPCFGRLESRDTYEPRTAGVESTLSGDATGRLWWYAGAGLTWMEPHFRAGFTDANGNVDNTTIDVRLRRATAFAGLSVQAAPAVTLSAQVYGVPEDVTTVRVTAGYRLR